MIRVRSIRVVRSMLIAALALMSRPSFATPGGPTCPEGSGPDVLVADIPQVANYAASGGMDLLSFATYACNVGSPNASLPSPLNSGELRWFHFQSLHPVIAQTFYVRKFVNGAWRFEQLGQSWLKHGFYADQDQQPFCCPTCTPAGGTPGERLGIGCSDLYSASRNGDQFNLGPKADVNPHTGNFPYPFTDPPYSGNGRRMQIPLANLVPSSATISYFAEAQYVSSDDSAAGNQNNNASYRPIAVTGGPSEFTFALAGATQRGQAALRAWKDADPSVVEIDVQVPDDGLFIVSYQVTNLNNGWWHYEYAIQNLNVNRAAASFAVPVPGCAQLQNIGFHDVDYLDGDGELTSNTTPVNFDGTDWAAVRAGGLLTWSTQTYAQNVNANALRWGTMYNFRFDSNKPPVSANATLGLYRAGSPASMLMTLQGPGGGEAPSCPANMSGGDNQVNVSDLLTVITTWGTSGPLGDCAPPCGDGAVNVADLLAVITAWGACP